LSTLISILYALVSMIVVLGIMIVVHEFGHFAAAKLFKVRVEVFAIGFGKRLFGVNAGKFTFGDMTPEIQERSLAGITDYRVSALPLGGYVKMAGENPMESRSGDAGEFMSHPRWQRLVIAFAGPFMNIVLAVGLLTAVFMVHYEHPVYLDQPAVIGYVSENSSADKVGVQIGDRITRIDNVENPTWEDVLNHTLISPNQPVTVTLQRGNESLQKTVVPDSVGQDEIGTAGWSPDQPNTITEITEDMPAYKAGLRLGDIIISVDKIPVRNTLAMVRVLQQSKDRAVEVKFVRNGQEKLVTLTPQLVENDGSGKPSYKIGVLCAPVHVDKLGFVSAMNRSIEQNQKNSVLILELVKRLMQGKAKMKQMSGPIGIARQSGEMAQQAGWLPLMIFMSLISLNLGLFNLFPFPILDGGMIVMLLVEGVLRRDISQPVKERIYQAAFVCLILFAGIVIFNDVMKVLPGLAKHLG
jgi:regulator of sigma E protease